MLTIPSFNKLMAAFSIIASLGMQLGVAHAQQSPHSISTAVAECMQPAQDPLQPYSNVRFSQKEDLASTPDAICPKLIAKTYDTTRHATRFKAFLTQDPVIKGTYTIPTEKTGLWYGKIRVDTNDWEERILLVAKDSAYLLAKDGTREKMFWKVIGDTLYFTTNFKYQHQLALTANKPITCLIDEIATPTEIEIDPQEKNTWQPVIASLDTPYLGVAANSGKPKLHKNDTNEPLSFTKTTVKGAVGKNKPSLSVVIPYKLSPKVAGFTVPVHHAVMYPQKDILQEFSLQHPTLGGSEKAYYSQALIGRKGAIVFLAVDRVIIGHLLPPTPTPCQTKNFTQFFASFASLAKEDQLLCAQFPFGVAKTPENTTLQPTEAVADLFDMLEQSAQHSKYVVPEQEVKKNNDTYKVSKTSDTTYTVQRMKKDGKASIAYYFGWDDFSWRLIGIASN